MSPGSTRISVFSPRDLRTNREGADQVERMLKEIGVAQVERVGLPWGAMHLDGLLNFLDRDLAVIWPRRTPYRIVEVLRERGFRFIEIEDETEAQNCLPLNFVALRPGEILMPTGAAQCAGEIRSSRRDLPHRRCFRIDQSRRRDPLHDRFSETGRPLLTRGAANAMLSHLEIRDFAIIDALSVRFGPGLNAMTGETGAGKSIIVDALGAVLGDRTSSMVVRSGARTGGR